MTVRPVDGESRCAFCVTGYPGLHADACPRSTAKPCVVCGRKYDQGKPDGRCLLDDEAHRTYTTTTIQEAA